MMSLCWIVFYGVAVVLMWFLVLFLLLLVISVVLVLFPRMGLMMVFVVAVFFFPQTVLTMVCIAVFFFLLCLFYKHDKDLLNKDSSYLQEKNMDNSVYTTSVFHVATRIKKIYGGKVFVGLRIPDAESKSLQNTDMVVVTKDAVMVAHVWDFTGNVDIDKDGSWVGMGHRRERHPCLVKETKRQVAIVESYLESRGVTLPKGYLIGRVVLPDPNCRVTSTINCLPEVISFNKCSRSQLKPEGPEPNLSKKKKKRSEPKRGFSNWFQDSFRGRKNDKQEGIHQKLHFILSTAPMWDRLELKGDRNVLGEFIEFKGKQGDLHALKNVERSKVSRLVIQKSSIYWGFDGSKIRVLYAPRDYRSEGGLSSKRKKATVESSTKVIFQPLNSKETLQIELSSILSLSLSA